MSVTVSIVEDFPLMRTAIADALAADPRIEVHSSCTDARTLLDSLVEHEPDVVLMDLHLPDMDGPRLVERIRLLHPSVRVVVFSACERPATVRAAIAAGASGYVVKRQSARDVADGLLAVMAGGTVLAPQVASAMLDGGAGAVGANGAPMPRLEQADMEIVRMVVDGSTDEQIARALYVSTRTVQNRLTRIRRGACVQRRTELARWALENQLV